MANLGLAQSQGHCAGLSVTLASLPPLLRTSLHHKEAGPAFPRPSSPHGFSLEPPGGICNLEGGKVEALFSRARAGRHAGSSCLWGLKRLQANIAGIAH